VLLLKPNRSRSRPFITNASNSCGWSLVVNLPRERLIA